jgi:putative ABC transport system substrate-binding protein
MIHCPNIDLKSAFCNLKSAILASPWPFALSVPAEAQQTKNVSRIGYLASVRGGLASTEDALRGGLRDLGYIEGRNIVIESRSAEGEMDRLPGLVADLIRLDVDVIVVTSIQGALAAKKATQSIPIVFAVAQDPVGSGLVASLAQPGGNVTGVTDFARELAGKRLERLKETVPKISRTAVLMWKPAGPATPPRKMISRPPLRLCESNFSLWR